MKNNKNDYFIAIIIIMITAIFLQKYQERQKKRKLTVQRVKNKINNGFISDKKNINNDYINISNDIYRSYEKLNKIITHETH